MATEAAVDQNAKDLRETGGREREKRGLISVDDFSKHRERFLLTYLYPEKKQELMKGEWVWHQIQGECNSGVCQ